MEEVYIAHALQQPAAQKRGNAHLFSVYVFSVLSRQLVTVESSMRLTGEVSTYMHSINFRWCSTKKIKKTFYIWLFLLITIWLSFLLYRNCRIIKWYAYNFQAFLVDVYGRAEGQHETDIPEHLGMCYIHSQTLSATQGRIEATMTSMKHQPIGKLQRKRT